MMFLNRGNDELLKEMQKKHEEFQEWSNLVNHSNIVRKYLQNLDWAVKENSNMSFSLNGLNNYITSKVSKDFWLSTIYTQRIACAHKKGDIHIHDLSMLSPYCVGWDLLDLLIKGFRGVRGKVHALAPKHFRSALGQVYNFFYTLQGESAGAQAFSNFDTFLAPFVKYDGLTYKDVKQAMQEFVFNLNVPTRTGFQTPFTNLTFDIKCPEHLRTKNVFAGKLRDDKYGDFQKEMDMINKAFCEVMDEGDGVNRVFSFPIPTYNITDDFDWNDKKYDGIWKMTAKFGIPYFSNFIGSDMKPEDSRSMCCRLRLDTSSLNKRGGGLFASNPLTGSIGVVTINLVRIGYLSKSIDEFKRRLLELMKIAKESLEIKRKTIEEFTEIGLYPYSKFYLQSVKDMSNNYWGNHFSTIGIIGMNEALLNLISRGIGTDEGKELALELMEFMRTIMLKFQEETGNNYNLEATPAEGTSFRLANIDVSTYKDIKHAGKNVPFYTNSTQLPVDFDKGLFKALDLQDELQCKYTGGTVFHVFIGEKMPDINSTKELVKKIVTNYKMPYFTLTPTFSICEDHGYIKGEEFVCPTCNKRCEVYSRIVGYLRPVDQWNKGKKQEFKQRSLFI